MTSRWSSRVTLTGAAEAGCPVASATIRIEAINGFFMTSLPVFRISSTAGLDRERSPEVPGADPGRSAGDSQDDADLDGERGGLLARLPATETTELAGELRVRLAWDRELDERRIGRVDAAALDGAESRDELGEATKRRGAVAHRQPARDVGRHERQHSRRPGRRPLGARRIGARLGHWSRPGACALLRHFRLAPGSHRGRFDLAADRWRGRRGTARLFLTTGVWGRVPEISRAPRGFVPRGRWRRRHLLLHRPARLVLLLRLVLLRRRARRRGLGREARLFGHRRRSRLQADRLLELGRGPVDVNDADGDEHDGGGFYRQLHGPGEEQSAQQASGPGRRSRRLEHPVDEARRRTDRRGPAQQRDGVPEALELAPALGARRQVAVEGGALVGPEGPVDQRRERLARVVAGHDRNRSSFSFRSIRARCSLDLTVPSSSSSAAAISSYDR